MNNEFFERENRMKQERERSQQQKHQTLETYNLEQQEAHHSGGVPDPKKYDVDPPQPGIIGRLLKLLGIRK